MMIIKSSFFQSIVFFICVDALVRRCEMLDIVGTRRGRGRPEKCWGEMIRQDMVLLQITEYMTLDKRM